MRRGSQLLSQITMTGKQDNVIIMGGFNYCDIDCANGTAYSIKDCHILNLLQARFMEQMVEASTRKMLCCIY